MRLAVQCEWEGVVRGESEVTSNASWGRLHGRVRPPSHRHQTWGPTLESDAWKTGTRMVSKRKVCNPLKYCLVITCQRSYGKVMFSLASVCSHGVGVEYPVSYVPSRGWVPGVITQRWVIRKVEYSGVSTWGGTNPQIWDLLGMRGDYSGGGYSPMEGAALRCGYSSPGGTHTQMWQPPKHSYWWCFLDCIMFCVEDRNYLNRCHEHRRPCYFKDTWWSHISQDKWGMPLDWYGPTKKKENAFIKSTEGGVISVDNKDGLVCLPKHMHSRRPCRKWQRGT